MVAAQMPPKFCLPEKSCIAVATGQPKKDNGK